MEILEASPALLFLGIVLLGLLVGSFLNVVAYRVPVMMERAWREQCADLSTQSFTPPPHAGERFDLLWPPSACPGCGKPIAPQHNVPVLSYLWLKGKCAACGFRISPRYPVVEAAAAVLGIAVAAVFGATPQTLAALGFTWTLLALALIDVDHKLLPDSMTLPLLWAGLLVNAFPALGAGFTDLFSAVIGAAAGYLSLWLVYWLFKLATGKEGMGYGDFKLLGAIGAWTGWQMLPLVILLSAAVGAVLGILMIAIQGRSRHTPIPFGPYLAAAGWIALLWGERIVAAYARYYAA